MWKKKKKCNYVFNGERIIKESIMKKVIVSLLSVFILIMFIPSINVYASDYNYEEYEEKDQKELFYFL